MQTIPIEGEWRQQVMGALSRTPLLRALKPDQLEPIMKVSTLLKLEPGESLTRQGDESDSFFMLVRGEASVLVEKAAETAVEVGRMRPPDGLGEIGLILGQRRSATVVAAEELYALRFDAKSFRAMFEKLPQFGLATCQGLAHRLEQISHKVPLPLYESRNLPMPEVLALIPVGVMQRHRLLPIKTEGNALTLGFVDDPTSQSFGAVEQLLPGMTFQSVRIDVAFFNEALRSYAGVAEWQAKQETPPKVAGEKLASPKLDSLIDRMVSEGASDLHMPAGQKVRWRIDGDIQEITDSSPLGPEDVWTLIEPVLSERNRKEFLETHDADFGYSTPNGTRVRVNLYRDYHGVNAALRLIPSVILTFDQLALPSDLKKLCEVAKGLVLVTGATGSGKSTTLAAMIDYINLKRPGHIITLEDPIEFVHVSAMSLMNQREIGPHAQSFAKALRACLREDPNVILVGEMRDLETVSLALEAANVGCLVFATLHTNSAISTIDRIVDMFPGDQQSKVRATLAEVLRGVVSQVLCRKTMGGRIAVCEVLMVNTAVSNLIREGKPNQIINVMQTGRNDGNALLNDELARLVKKGSIRYEEAQSKSLDRKDLARRCDKPEPTL